VKVNCSVNGASHDAPKEATVAQLLEKNIVQLFPSSEAEIPANATATATATAPNKVSLDDEFCLTNIIFSDELTELALRSEESATCAELDAGLVGHNSPFWRIAEARFNEGFHLTGQM
jgi:hypothetical protein